MNNVFHSEDFFNLTYDELVEIVRLEWLGQG